MLDRVHNGPYGLPAVRAAEEAASESPTSVFSSSVRTLSRGNPRPTREPRTERELMSLDQGILSLFERDNVTRDIND